MINHTLYQQIADAVRAHSGSEELVEAVFAVTCDEVESLAANRADEQLRQSDERPTIVSSDHTEDEAGQRWCPHAREATPVGKGKKDVAIGNRYMTMNDDYPNPAGCRCIASHCMAWRWSSADRGHCGLAGPVVVMAAGEPRRLRNRMPPARVSPEHDLL
jgi:hypothetical protein